MSSSGSRRLPAEQRRQLIVKAAQEAFAHRGYEGTSTDTIARAARVSQGHVIRLFGTKQALFEEVVTASLGRIAR